MLTRRQLLDPVDGRMGMGRVTRQKSLMALVELAQDGERSQVAG